MTKALKNFIYYCKSLIGRKYEYNYEVTRIFKTWGLIRNSINIELKINKKIVYDGVEYSEESDTIIIYFPIGRYTKTNSFLIDICRFGSNLLNAYKFAPLNDDIIKKAVEKYCLKENFTFTRNGKHENCNWQNVSDYWHCWARR